MKMTLLRRSTFLLCMALLSVTLLRAQMDAHFSQYMFNGLHINPAYAGYRGVWNLNAGFRNQWMSFPGSPKTISATLDGTTHNERVGLGLNLTSDRIGSHNTTLVYGTYAYRFPISAARESGRLALGISLGIIQEAMDKTRLDPFDNTVPDHAIEAVKPNMILPDARFGIYYNTDKFYAGLSADNMLTNTFKQKKDAYKAFLDRKLHVYLTAGGLITLTDDLSLKPSLLIKDDLAGPTSADFSSFLLIQQKIWVGVTYRRTLSLYKKEYLLPDLKKSDVVVGLLEVNINDNLRLGYSYDYMLNSSMISKYGTHELSIGYYLVSPKTRMLSPRNF